MKLPSLLLLLCLITAQAWGQCPSAALCQPGSASATNAALGMGIYRVVLANLDTTTNGATDGYQNYACRTGALLQRGGTYTLTVSTNPSVNENVGAWLDFDDNGIFDPSNERVLWSAANRVHTALFTVPATALLNRPLRLRIAADYFGVALPAPCTTPVYSQTEDYRVLVQAGSLLPTADFLTIDTVTCSGRVQWQDVSRNSPTAWAWNFGDGSTSNQRNPVHQYATPGRYSVSLRVCGNTGCDSLRRVNYVSVRNDGPRPAGCVPTTVAYCCNYGITRTRFATIDRSSANGAVGYEDFSCTDRAVVTAGRGVGLQLATGPNDQDVRIYLDSNNDGIFTMATELVYQALGVKDPAATLVFAASLPGLVYNQPLRLRITADYAGSPATMPCGPFLQGQAEDYTVVMHPDTTPPTASFNLTYEQLCQPVRVAVRNTTTGTPTSYYWSFGDGTTSALATPGPHTYAVPGLYEVQLVVSNLSGSDTVRQNVAVAVCQSSYCTAPGLGGSSTSPASFTRIQLGNIDNTNSRAYGTGYYDFTSQYTVVQAGQQYTLRAESLPWQFSGSGPWAQVAIWLDYNQDGLYGASEEIGPLTSYSPHLLTFRVPTNAKLGATRMRVRIQSLANPLLTTSCTTAGLNASTEDYTVVVVPALGAPAAGFRADLNPSCSGFIQFRDTSWAGPTRWQWNFGDGGTSTLQNPQHRYTALGTYTVALLVSNRHGTHQLVRPNYVVVTGTGNGPQSAACLPNANVLQYWGIGELTIGPGFTYTQLPRAVGYQDETCSLPPLYLARGAGHEVSFRAVRPVGVNPNSVYNVYMWLDSNDDGIFEKTSELLYSSGPGGVVQTGLLVLPPSVPLNHPLRLRVQYITRDYLNLNTAVPDPCYRDEGAAQVRDFALIATGGTPTAVPDISSPTAWQLYPNPTDGLVTVKGAFLTLATVEIYDTVGRKVHAATVSPTASGELPLVLKHLASGIYLVRINSQPTVRRLLLR